MKKDKKPVVPEENDEEDIDLKSELEDNIEKMNTLIKSTDSASIKELLSNDKTRELIKAEMNEYCDHFVNLTIMRDNVLVRHADK